VGLEKTSKEFSSRKLQIIFVLSFFLEKSEVFLIKSIVIILWLLVFDLFELLYTLERFIDDSNGILT